jgi:hypothetical protein
MRNMDERSQVYEGLLALHSFLFLFVVVVLASALLPHLW